MATVKSQASLTGHVSLILTEDEARALDAIVGYGPDAFVKWFYKNHGQHYLKPHETAMRSFFDTTRTELGKQLRRFDDARDVFNGRKEARTPQPINTKNNDKP